MTNRLAGLRENLGLKALSLALAAGAFLFAQSQQTFEETVVVAVRYLPSDDLLQLNDQLPDRVVVQASGSRPALKNLQQKARDGSLEYVVDMEESEVGRALHSFRRRPRGIPSQVTIDTVSPSEVELIFDEVGTRTLPVTLRLRGRLPSGFVERSRTVEPAEVSLIGARSELESMQEVDTVPLRLTELRTPFDGEVELDVRGLHLTDESPRSVRVSLGVEEAIATRELPGIPVEVAAEFGPFTIEPPTCLVRLEGPVPVLDAVSNGGLVARLTGDASALVPNEGRPIRVAYTDSKPGAAAAPGARLFINHPRADELRVVSVEPAVFKATQLVTEEEDPRPDGPESGSRDGAGDAGGAAEDLGDIGDTKNVGSAEGASDKG